ncbi:hypothetical protein [Sulfitobacter alexandrii]|nr:hypothetical protein [Sulfitobacter alexandrii]
MSVAAAQADQVIPDDLIVKRDICVGGIQCVDGEVFGDADIKIKSSDPELQFFDTSTSAPSWSIITNRGTLPGFTIRQDDSGRRPIEVALGAATNTLFLGNDLKVGIGTSVPEANLDIVSQGGTARIGLKSNGSPQVGFKLSVDTLGFFLNDDSDDAVPFAIDSGAPTGSIYVVSNGNVGLGTVTPQEKLHIRTTAPDTDAFALFEAAGSGSDSAFRIRQNGLIPTTWEFRNQQTSGRLNVGIAGGNTPFKIDNTAANNLLRLGRNGRPDEVVVTGTLVVNNTDMNVPDYVFEPGYDLPTLAEIDAFIADNGHLPGVPSAAEVAGSGLDMTRMQMAQLEKIEELTLHTISQENRIAAQEDRIAAQEDRIAEQQEEIASYRETLAVLARRLDRIEAGQ